MAAYCRVYDSRDLQAECQELESAAEPYTQPQVVKIPGVITQKN